LPGADAHVLLVLAVHADTETYECWPTRRTLAARVRRAEGSVGSALRGLVEMGLIERRQGGDGKPAITRLLVERNNSPLANDQAGSGAAQPPVNGLAKPSPSGSESSPFNRDRSARSVLSA
jgi:Helix-turn-helix domain